MAEDIELGVARHYGAGGLFGRILAALEASGVREADITAEHLRSIDEFHIGGAPATEHLLDPLGIAAGDRVLDVGCGIGGATRHIRRTYGAEVVGVDLTPEFVATAEAIGARLGVDVRYVLGSALDLPFDDADFDFATLIHVGMNIPDKPGLFADVARVLKPGGVFAVYDVMRLGNHPTFPLPWSTGPETSFLDAQDVYLGAADAAGFVLEHHEERGEVARDFFARMQARMAAAGLPAVGLPMLMGETAPQKVGNMVAAVNAGDIAPVEMVFRRAE